jgi:hypothetical protein
MEGIRNKAIELERREWTVKFTWIKAHAGNQGNEIADNLAKEATQKQGNNVQQNTEKPNSISEITEYRKVAHTMEKKKKRINNKTVLPKY